MNKDIDRSGLDANFWKKKKLNRMTRKEWEALCDGCGKCCMNKLEDSKTGEVAFTKIACRIFDDSSCRCSHYFNRHQIVPNCISLTPTNLNKHQYWLPKTCAYKLIFENKPLYDWHPLISGNQETVYQAGVSMKENTIPETTVSVHQWDHFIIEEPE
ncbi:MAG: YcgN family cysteine cluster protein [Aestuariivita sp.]|nr:YcgN family cysteine cluster protein [Aestuariivita sp.]